MNETSETYQKYKEKIEKLFIKIGELEFLGYREGQTLRNTLHFIFQNDQFNIENILKDMDVHLDKLLQIYNDCFNACNQILPNSTSEQGSLQKQLGKSDSSKKPNEIFTYNARMGNWRKVYSRLEIIAEFTDESNYFDTGKSFGK